MTQQLHCWSLERTIVPQAAQSQAASIAMGWESCSSQGWDRAMSHTQHIPAVMGIRIGKILPVVASRPHLICLPLKPPLHPCPYTVPSIAFTLSFPGLGENHGTKDKTLIPGHSSENVLQHLALKKKTPFLHLTPSEHCIGIEPFVLTTQTQIWPVLSPDLCKEGNRGREWLCSPSARQQSLPPPPPPRTTPPFL